MGDTNSILLQPSARPPQTVLNEADEKLRAAFAQKDRSQVQAALGDDYQAFATQGGDKVGTKEFFDHVAQISGGTIPPAYVADLQGLIDNSSALQPSISSSVWGADMSKAHWADGNMNLYPSGMPTTKDINQHGIGDCDVESALASWAQSDPQGLMSHITQNGTGADATYTVKMVDPNGNPVDFTVDGKMLKNDSGEPISGSSADGTANWSTVMEKALAKYDDAYGLGAIGGEGSEKAIRAFTGSNSSKGLNAGKATVADVMANVKPGNVVTGGFNTVLTLPNGDKTVTAHGYAVLGTVTENGQTYVEMRNPWGNSPTASGHNAASNGVIKVSQADFEKYCDLRVISLQTSTVGGRA